MLLKEKTRCALLIFRKFLTEYHGKLLEWMMYKKALLDVFDRSVMSQYEGEKVSHKKNSSWIKVGMY